MDTAASPSACIACGEPLREGAIRCTRCFSLQGECVVCGEFISPKARRCSFCKAYQYYPDGLSAASAVASPCVACRSPLPAGAVKCRECSTIQFETKPCDVCGESIHKNASRCIRCQSYQGHWRHLAILAVIATIAGTLWTILSATIPRAVDFFGDSETSVMVLSATTDRIYVHAANRGPKASILRGYRLVFTDLPLESAELKFFFAGDAEKDTALVPPRGARVVTLTTDGIRSTVPEPDLSVELDRLRKLDVFLVVDVEESGEKTLQSRMYAVPVHAIDAFLRANAHYEEVAQ